MYVLDRLVPYYSDARHRLALPTSAASFSASSASSLRQSSSFFLSCILQLAFLHFSRSFAPSAHSPLLSLFFSLPLPLSLSLFHYPVCLLQGSLPLPPFLPFALCFLPFLFFSFSFFPVLFYLASLAYLDLRHLFLSRLSIVTLFFNPIPTSEHLPPYISTTSLDPYLPSCICDN